MPKVPRTSASRSTTARRHGEAAFAGQQRLVESASPPSGAPAARPGTRADSRRTGRSPPDRRVDLRDGDPRVDGKGHHRPVPVDQVRQLEIRDSPRAPRRADARRPRDCAVVAELLATTIAWCLERVRRVEPEALGQQLDRQGELVELVGRVGKALEAVRHSLDDLADLVAASPPPGPRRSRCSSVASEISRAARCRVGEGVCGAAPSTPGWRRLWSSTSFGRLAALLGRHDDGANRRGKLVEQRPHRVDRLSRPLGEPPHLLGDHRESLAVLAGRRRFDGRVERQDVGFLGDLGDQVEDPVDLPRRGCRACRLARRSPRSAAEPPRPPPPPPREPTAPSFPAASARAASSACPAALIGDRAGGARQLLHGGGDLDHRRRLLRRAGRQLGRGLMDLPSGGGDLDRRALDLIEQACERLPWPTRPRAACPRAASPTAARPPRDRRAGARRASRSKRCTGRHTDPPAPRSRRSSRRSGSDTKTR